MTQMHADEKPKDQADMAERRVLICANLCHLRMVQ